MILVHISYPIGKNPETNKTIYEGDTTWLPIVPRVGDEITGEQNKKIHWRVTSVRLVFDDYGSESKQGQVFVVVEDI